METLLQLHHAAGNQSHLGSRSGTELPGPLRAWRTESYCYVRDMAGTTCLYGRSDKIRSCWVKKQDADKAPQW